MGSFVLDLGWFPLTLRLSVCDGVPSADGVDLPTVSSWYVRSLPLPLPLPFRVAPAADTRVQQRDYAAGRERRSFDALRAAGVPIPPTLATNDPHAVVEFARGARRRTSARSPTRRPRPASTPSSLTSPRAGRR